MKSIERQMKETEPSRRKGALYRIKATQHGMLSHMIVKVLFKHNQIQDNFRQACIDQIQRNLENCMCT